VFKSTEHAANLFALKEFGNIYSRIMNPTVDVFEMMMAAVEGGSGSLAVSSGQAATSLALLAITRLGDEIVSANNLYGGTYELFHHTFPKRCKKPGDPPRLNDSSAAFIRRTKGHWCDA